MSEIIIAGKKIGDGNPAYITYEAGPNHTGVEEAIELVKMASYGKADAIKFQIIDPDRLVANRHQIFEYDILLDKKSGKTKKIKEPLYDILCRRAMSFEDWRKVKAAADDVGIAFFATVGFEDEVDFLIDIGCDSIKIASSDLNHFPLLRMAARSGMVVQIDTGTGSIGDVEKAVDVMNQEGCDQIIIHQCPSGYPAHTESIHLNMIKTLKQMFPYPIAFSDHTPGWHMDVAAVSLGANLIEKTITKDRCTPSVEHIFSLEAEDTLEFIKIIREVEVGLGMYRRPILEKQINEQSRNRRSVFTRTKALAGTCLDVLDIEYRRAGTDDRDGITPEQFERIKSLKVVGDLPREHKLTLSDVI